MTQDLKYRLGGLLALVVGVAACWFFLLVPLQQAQAGAPEVSYQLRVFVLVPLCIVFGLAFVVLGAGLNYRDVERKTLTPLGWALFAVIVVLTGAGYFWFQQQFSALGYT